MSDIFASSTTASGRPYPSPAPFWLTPVRFRRIKWVFLVVTYGGLFLVFPGVLLGLDLFVNVRLSPAQCEVREVLGVYTYALVVVPADPAVPPFDHVFKARRGERFAKGDNRPCFFRIDAFDALYTPPIDVETVQFHSDKRPPNKAGVAVLSVFLAIAAALPFLCCLCWGCFYQEDLEVIANAHTRHMFSCPDRARVPVRQSQQREDKEKAREEALLDEECWMGLEDFEMATRRDGYSATVEEL